MLREADMYRFLRTALILGALVLPFQQAFAASIDREYAVTISPQTVTPLSTTQFSLTVTNFLLTGQSNNIQSITITVPTGFTFKSSDIIPPPYWTASVNGQTITLSTPQSIVVNGVSV